MSLRLDDDLGQHQRLRRNKAAALGLLLAMGGLLLLTYALGDGGFWVGLLRAAAEAGLVGGLADWFAVTAIFRRPMGLPIPHTGIVAAQQERIGHGIGRFVEHNFLAPELIAARLESLDPAQRLADWLRQPAQAGNATDRLAQSLPALLDAAASPELRLFLGRTLGRELARLDIAPALARAFKVLGASQEGNALFDRGLDALLDLLHEHRDLLRETVERRTAWWVPRAVDRRILRTLTNGLEATVEELRRPDGEARHHLKQGLARVIVERLQSPEQRGQLARIGRRLLEDAGIQRWLGTLWDQLRGGLAEDLAQPAAASLTREALGSVLVSTARLLDEDAELRQRVNELTGAVVLGTVGSLQGEISRFIAAIVHGWDTKTIVDRLELAIGSDLQFVRINGTLVGACVGCLLFLLHRALTA